MEPLDPRVARLLNLTESAYYDYSEALGTRIELAASDLPFRGLALTAPTEVAVGVRDALPGLLLVQRDDLHAWASNLERNTAVVAVDLLGHRVVVRGPFGTSKRRDRANRPRSREGEPPTGAQATALNTGIHPLDLRGLGDLPWGPGVWAFTALCHDEVSNTVVVTLTGDVAPLVEPVSREEAAALWALADHARVNPAALPALTRTPWTPPLERVGVALNVPREVVSGFPLVVYGAALLPLPASSLVAAGEGWAEDAALPAAVLRGTALLTGLDEDQRHLVDVRVPIFSNAPLRPGEPVRAAFTLDLTASLADPLPVGEWCVHLFLGAYRAGPFLLVVTAPDVNQDDLSTTLRG
jgi:hypothetical protein